jgi:hypothetical protein
MKFFTNKLFFVALFVLMTLASYVPLVSAQPGPSGGVNIKRGATLPATCDPTAKSQALFYKTTAPTIGLYQCLTVNTWTYVSTGVPASLNGSVFFNGDLLQHVNHGVYFTPTTHYTDAFYEGWVKPSVHASVSGYIVSDDHGGNHNILWGIQYSNATCSVTGNIYNGTSLESFTGAENFPCGYWQHLAVAIDLTNGFIETWINGVLSSVQATSSTFTTQGGGSDPDIFIGGSDHNNYYGNIAMLRFYNGSGVVRFNSDFVPEKFFRPTWFLSGTTHKWANFVVHYTSPSTLYVDRGSGFEGISHDGVPEALQSVLGTDQASGPFIGTGLSLPTFQYGDVTPGIYVPTAPTTPASPIVWDSFSRVDRTSVNPTDFTTGNYVLGNTEAGSAGVLAWTLPDGTSDTSGHGVLNGRAFIVNGATNVCVETSTQDVDVRVDRGIIASYGKVGLDVRYKNANDHYLVTATSDTNINVDKYEGGVHTGVSYTPTGGWVTLRVVEKGTTFTVYTGTATEGVFTSQGTFTSTNITGATKACLARDNNVRSVWRWDNFLVKAAP